MSNKFSHVLSLLSKRSSKENVNSRIKNLSLTMDTTTVGNERCSNQTDIIDLTVDSPERPTKPKGLRSSKNVLTENKISINASNLCKGALGGKASSNPPKNMLTSEDAQKLRSGRELAIIHEGLPEYIGIQNNFSSRRPTMSVKPGSNISKRLCHTSSIDEPKKLKSPKKIGKSIKIERELQVSDSDEEFSNSKELRSISPIIEKGKASSQMSKSVIEVSKNHPNLNPMNSSHGPEGVSSKSEAGPDRKFSNWEDVEYHIHINDQILGKRQIYEQSRPWCYSGPNINSHSKCVNLENRCAFTVLSYNVLAPSIVPNTRFLYEDCSEEFLSWRYRWHLFQYEIRQANPDIVTLQEVDSNLYESHFLPWFSYNGFKGLYKKRTHDRNDGCAIFYRANQFRLIESCSVEYYQPHGGASLDRDNVGLIAKLSPHDFDSPFSVVTTHLLYNPKRHDVRLAQMALLLTEMDRICYVRENMGHTEYCPSILTGDFNTTPESKVVELLATGRVNLKAQPAIGSFYASKLINPALGITDYCKHSSLEQSRYRERKRGTLFSLHDKRKIEEDLIHLSHSERFGKASRHTGASASRPSQLFGHDFQFKSVYDLTSASSVTTRHERWLTVDYMFYTTPPAKSTEKLELVGYCKLPDHKQASWYGPLPSNICPSDHFPLGARFILSNGKKRFS